MEEYRDIPDYEGSYQVSNFGNVLALRYHQGRFSRVLKPKTDKYGYLCVRLSRKGVGKCFTIHRLVMLTFKGKSNLTVNHIDKNKINNKLSNLEYMSNKDNVRYSLAHKIKATNIQTGEVLHFKSTKETNEHGFSQGDVWACLKNIKKTHHGFRWEYEEVI